ncbi:MAG: hypothetical protein QOK27_2316, partial [Gemmatimonadales bacterium]|nr:hypothetical protein [Gemmatimonadales bacterium]
MKAGKRGSGVAGRNTAEKRGAVPKRARLW